MINPRREVLATDLLPIYLAVFENIYEIRFLKRKDVPSMLALQETVAKSLPRPEIYRVDPIEYIYGHFSRSQNVIGAVVGEELVAYHVVSFPGLRADNFGWDIQLNQSQLLKAAHFETTAVQPEHRSKHLARIMADIHTKILKYAGYEHVLCTVSPMNYQSLCNVFQQGFLIKGIKEKYYGIRYIMHKKLKLSAIRKPHDIIWLRENELVTQQTLIERGYYGFSVRSTGDGLEIAYGIMDKR